MEHVLTFIHLLFYPFVAGAMFVGCFVALFEERFFTCLALVVGFGMFFYMSCTVITNYIGYMIV